MLTYFFKAEHSRESCEFNFSRLRVAGNLAEKMIIKAGASGLYQVVKCDCYLMLATAFKTLEIIKAENSGKSCQFKFSRLSTAGNLANLNFQG